MSFFQHTIDTMETLLYQTKQHMKRCREQGEEVDLLRFSKIHYELETAIFEIKMEVPAWKT